MERSRRTAVMLLRVSSIYLAIGLGLGMFMAISRDHTLSTVHSHLSFLGWGTLAFAGIVYLLLPACGANRLATLHFWLQNVGLPIMIVGLAGLYQTGNASFEPIIGVGSTLVTVGLVLFVVNVLLHAGAAAPPSAG